MHARKSEELRLFLQSEEGSMLCPHKTQKIVKVEKKTEGLATYHYSTGAKSILK